MSKTPRQGLYEETFPWTVQGGGNRHLVVLDGLRVENTPPAGLALQGIGDALGPLADRRTVWTLGRRKKLPEGTRIEDLAEETARVVRDLVPEPRVLWGMGVGGAIAVEAASRFPDLATGLVVVSSGPFLSTRGRDLYKRLIVLAAKRKWSEVHALLGSVVFTSRWAAWLGGLVARLFAGDLGIPADPWDFLVTLQAELAYNGTRAIKNISCPSLVLHGEQDPLYDAEAVRAAWSGKSGAEVGIWSRKPHALLKVDRDAVTDRIQEFLSKVEPPRTSPLV